MNDLISRQAAMEAIKKAVTKECALWSIEALPTAERVGKWIPVSKKLPEPERYTKEELRVFRHGISLSLLSKRSAQHWRYDEDTATEIKFLERLYEKVGADMRGEEDDSM